SGSRQQVDLGKVAGGGWFSTVLCAGFDAQVNARANRLRWLSGHWRYDVALLIELSRLHAMPLRVETPETIVELDATLVAVGNTSWYGGGIPICPDANPADGLLDIPGVGEVTLRECAATLAARRPWRPVAQHLLVRGRDPHLPGREPGRRAAGHHGGRGSDPAGFRRDPAPLAHRAARGAPRGLHLADRPGAAQRGERLAGVRRRRSGRAPA